MAWRIGATDGKASSYRVGQSNFMPILRILVESAAFYLVAELILLILYACNNNAQFIALEAITPVTVSFGITSNAITIRITLRSETKSSVHAGDYHRFSAPNDWQHASASHCSEYHQYQGGRLQCGESDWQWR
ncbi:hypothetical protein DFH06DRAFT_290223 [Mycena polygramma]|nr:hypothetical protein DFH06DRAFT_290223 [Mycena polygramma]